MPSGQFRLTGKAKVSCLALGDGILGRRIGSRLPFHDQCGNAGKASMGSNKFVILMAGCGRIFISISIPPPSTPLVFSTTSVLARALLVCPLGAVLPLLGGYGFN
jgi:hypothetical protein